MRNGPNVSSTHTGNAYHRSQQVVSSEAPRQGEWRHRASSSLLLRGGGNLSFLMHTSASRMEGWPCCVGWVLALLFFVPALAQDASPFRDLDRYAFGYAYPGSQLKDHVYERSRRFFAAGDAQRDALATVDAVRRRQEDIRRIIDAGLGGLPSADTPLNARVTGVIEGDGFR